MKKLIDKKSEPYILVDKLNYSIDGNSILKDVSFQLSTPGVLGLFGRNGEGKSTLFKLLSGSYIADNYESIKLCGHSFEVSRNPLYYNSFYYIPEAFSLPPIYQKAFVKKYKPFYKNFDDDFFKEMLERFNISKNKNLGKMSLGEKQKFLISFGIALGVKILIMDEPLNGMDIDGKTIFKELLKDSRVVEKRILISSHLIRDLDDVIDDVAILAEKEIKIISSYENIRDKLACKLLSSDELEKDILFKKEFLSQKIGLVRRSSMEEYLNFNLEVFFYAIHENLYQIKSILEEK